jgi:hypothetical protein
MESVDEMLWGGGGGCKNLVTLPVFENISRKIEHGH